MIGYATRVLAIVAIAGGLPYAWFSDGAKQLLTDYAKWGGLPAEAPVRKTFAVPRTDTRSFAASSVTGLESTGSTTDKLEQILRFDLTDQDIIARWPRVTTILSNHRRMGLRVPLVTGTQPTDIAGSLSYYFDSRGRVRRISLAGHTGDASELVGMVGRRFKLRPEPSIAAGLFITRWNAWPTCGLLIRHVPVVRAEDPLSQQQVNLEINRPDTTYTLSPEFLRLIDQDRRARGGEPN